MSTFFSSDWHMSHKNVLEYDKRPFKDISHHDETIINNYNSVVNTDDDFYYLGDFAFTNKKRIESFLARLNGHKYFIKGNHDKRDTIKLYEKYGTYLGEQKKIRVDGHEIVLNHFAMRIWEGSHKGVYHLYGHSHGKIETEYWGKSMDVCIILNDYFPFEFNQIEKIMNKRDIKFLGDHHKEE